MKTRMFTSFAVAAALAAAPLVASADPKPVAAHSQSSTKPTTPTQTPDDANNYAQREKQAPAAANFEGGAEGIYIGGSVLTIALVVVLLVILL